MAVFKRVLRSFGLIWRRAPVPGALGFLSLMTLVVWLATIPGNLTLVKPNPEIADTLWVGVGEGEVVIQKWVDRPMQAARPDQWSVGSSWLGLGIWYIGTYQPPGTVNIEGVFYQARFPLWLFLLLFGAYPAAKAFRYWRWWRRRPSVWCRCCRYDLAGNVSGVCPECGTPIARASTK